MVPARCAVECATFSHAMRRALPLLISSIFACSAPAPPPPVFASRPSWSPGASLAVVGDLQRTSAWELLREHNDPERARVVRYVAERKPALLVLLGDLVFDGRSQRHWEQFDTLTAPVRDAGIPVLPLVGNHDLGWWGESAVANLEARFPLMEHTTSRWIRFGPLGVVTLNSNSKRLGPERWRKQAAWFSAVLSALDSDPRIKATLVFLHHPPYTNSSVTGDTPEVQRDLVPAFLSCRKTIAMIAGHVHSYEHFFRQDRHFIVAGGGGGPRAKLLEGTERRHTDDVFHGPALRPFHVLLLTPRDQGLEFEASGLEKGSETWRVLERSLWSWPRS